MVEEELVLVSGDFGSVCDALLGRVGVVEDTRAILKGVKGDFFNGKLPWSNQDKNI